MMMMSACSKKNRCLTTQHQYALIVFYCLLLLLLIQACMDEMEKDLEFDELRLLRELTFRQLEKRISAGEVSRIFR